MLGPFATASRFTLPFTRCRYCRTPPAHRCPRRRPQQRQRQRVTEGTAMAPWNGPKKHQEQKKVGKDKKAFGNQEFVMAISRYSTTLPARGAWMQPVATNVARM